MLVHISQRANLFKEFLEKKEQNQQPNRKVGKARKRAKESNGEFLVTERCSDDTRNEVCLLVGVQPKDTAKPKKKKRKGFTCNHERRTWGIFPTAASP